MLLQLHAKNQKILISSSLFKLDDILTSCKKQKKNKKTKNKKTEKTNGQTDKRRGYFIGPSLCGSSKRHLKQLT